MNKKLTTPKSILIGAFMISLSILYTNGFNFSIIPEVRAQDNSVELMMLQLKLDMITTQLDISKSYNGASPYFIFCKLADELS